jgi:hypothetical protein
MQTDLALPDMPIEAIRLYPDSDRAIDSQRMETERYVIIWPSHHVATPSPGDDGSLCMCSTRGSALVHATAACASVHAAVHTLAH